MLEKYINQPYQQCLLKPVAYLNRYTKLSPNMITLLACLSGLLVPFFCYYQQVDLALSAIIISGYFDTLDGYVARLQHRQSPLGSMFDIMSDRIVESAIIIGLFLIAPQSRSLLTLLMLSSVLICVTSFLVVGILVNETSHKSFFYHLGLIDRPEAFCFFIMMLLLPAYFHVLAISFTILVLLTAFLRLLSAKQLLQVKQSHEC